MPWNLLIISRHWLGNGLVLSGNKSLPEPILTQTYELNTEEYDQYSSIIGVSHWYDTINVMVLLDCMWLSYHISVA